MLSWPEAGMAPEDIVGTSERLCGDLLDITRFSVHVENVKFINSYSHRKGMGPASHPIPNAKSYLHS